MAWRWESAMLCYGCHVRRTEGVPENRLAGTRSSARGSSPVASGGFLEIRTTEREAIDAGVDSTEKVTLIGLSQAAMRG